MADDSQLDLLLQEHDAARKLIEALHDEVRALGSSRTEAASLSACRNCLDSLREALLLHFRVEEEGLFPDVQRIVGEGAPKVDILSSFFGDESEEDLKAHTLLRARMKEFADLCEQAQSSSADENAAARLQHVLELTRDLLLRHAEKESTTIFPLITRLLTPEQRSAVEDKMRSIRQSAAQFRQLCDDES